MAETVEVLYHRMISHFFEWSNTPSPHSSHRNGANLLEFPKELDKLGTFRDGEWIKYCDARDKWLQAVTVQEELKNVVKH